MELDSTQEAVVSDLLSKDHQGGAIFASLPGAGKTLPAVEVTLRMGASVALLVVPLGTRVGWERTFRSRGYEGELYRLTSANKENFDKLKAREPGVYLIGWEYAVRQRAVKWSQIKPDVAIADEAHRGANRKAKSFTMWSQIKPKQLKLSLSGTWFGNKFSGAWAVARALWPHLVDASFWRWADKFARIEEEYVGSPNDPVKTVRFEKTPGAFVKTLPAYYVWEPVGEENDIWQQEPLKLTLYSELSKKHRKLYTQMEDDLIAWVGDNPLVADYPMSKYMRLRQMSLGIPSVEETGKVKEDGTPEVRVWFDQDCESPKIDVLNEFLDGYPDRNVLVLLDSRAFSDVLPARIKANVRVWTGETPQEEREEILRTWGTNPDKREVLVATIQAIGEGVDGLQHVCNTRLWLNKSTNGILNDQAAARVARRGQTQRVLDVEIIAPETEDEPDNTRLHTYLKERTLSVGGANVGKETRND